MTEATAAVVADLPADLADGALTPESTGYREAQHTYAYRGAPALILRPRSADSVSSSVALVIERGLPFAVRSGGHGVSGRATNDGGAVIDLGALSRVEVIDGDSGLVRVGAGARWAEVADTLAPHGLAISSGDSGDVGVGGLATVGGIGLLGRRDGLTIDHVVGAEMVTADGRVVRADSDHEPDLFWAIRGAGANVGIVTSFDFRARRLEMVGHAQVTYDWPTLTSVLPVWAAAAAAAPREATAFLYVFGRPGAFQAVATIAVTLADEAAIRDALDPFVRVPGAVGSRARMSPYPSLLPRGIGAHTGAAESAVRSSLLNSLDEELALDLERVLGSADLVQVRTVGGAINDVPPDATAYAHRHQQFSLVAAGRSVSADELDAAWAPVRAKSDGLYLNFDNSGDPGLVTVAYPPDTLARLHRIKNAWDPSDRFNDNFDIGN